MAATKPKLTAEDWQEIYSALDSKKRDVERGNLDPEDNAGDNSKWTAHLNEILATIGPDGRNMWPGRK